MLIELWGGVGREWVQEWRSSSRSDGTEIGTGCRFGRSAVRPCSSSTVIHRAVRSSSKARLAPIGLHEARHISASYLIAAGARLEDDRSSRVATRCRNGRTPLWSFVRF